MKEKRNYLNKIVRRAGLCLIGMALFVGACIGQHFLSRAASTEMTIDLDHAYEEGVFYITWENTEEEGSVTITSPSGTVYSEKKTPDQVYEANGEAIVNVGKAEEGTWTIQVSGNDLGTVDVTMGELPNSLIIDEFSVSPKSDGSFQASYKVTDCPDEIYVEIFADTDNSGYDGEQVYGENGGASGTVAFDLGYLASGEYHFYMYVSADGIYQNCYCEDAFSYQNPDDAEKVSGVKGGKYNDGYYISWDAAEDESYIVRVWDAERNLILTEEVGYTDVYYGDFSGDDTTAYLAVTRANENCKYDLVTADKSVQMDADVVYDIEGDVTSNSFINATVTLKGNQSFDVFLGDEQLLQDETESGMYRVDLQDGENEILFVVTDAAGNAEEFVKDIYVDTVPPQLSVSEDINGKVVTQDTIYLSGYTEASASLTLNGEPVELTQSYFNQKVTLVKGENTLTLTAEDAAGNQSVYTAVVTYETAKTVKRTMEYILLGAMILILLVLYIIVFVKGRKRRKQA